MKIFLKQIFFTLVIISYAPTISCAYQPMKKIKAKAEDLLCKHGLDHPATIFGKSEKHGHKDYCVEINPFKDTCASVIRKIARKLGVGPNKLTQNSGKKISAISIVKNILAVEKQKKELGNHEVMILHTLVD